ncbi:DUF7344 domain-containing protein, partial [Haloparvum sedimenti]|uniref:DUF7344 domain-containing protein n=1 Tax=Haloparvum sedimenti TaxID=1678448 RepID=UPI00071E7214
MSDSPQEPDDGPEATADEASLLTDDRFFTSLASARRRRLLVLLSDEESRPIDELATLLAGWDATEKRPMTNAAERDRIRVDLRHVHLPMLDEVGLVDYDRENEEVAPVPLPDLIDTLVSKSVAA